MVRVKNSLRTLEEKQYSLIYNWSKQDSIGTLVAPRGFNKPKVAIKAIKHLQSFQASTQVIVIVPDGGSITQWEHELKKEKVEVEEIILSTQVSKCFMYADLVIIDKIEDFEADELSFIFNNITATHILGLAGNLGRGTEIHELVEMYAPIFERVITSECPVSWISNCKEYNLGIELTQGEKVAYNTSNNQYNFYENLLGGKYNAIENGAVFTRYGNELKRGQAKVFWNTIKRRKKILLESTNKLTTTEKLVNKFTTRDIVIFSKTNNFASKIENRLAGICSFFEDGGKRTDQELALRRFEDTRTMVRAISTTKPFVPGIIKPNMAIITGTSNNVRDHENRTTKSLFNGHSPSIVVNLYIKDFSHEEVWLDRRQRNIVPTWIENISEIK